MGRQINVGGRTFVLELPHCPCEECPKKVEKQLLKIHGIGSIGIDMAQGKVTITDSMVDPDTIIKELAKINKKAELFSEEIASIDKEKGKEIVVSEIFKDQAALVVCKPVARNQVVDELALIEMTDCDTKHEQTFELKKFSKSPINVGARTFVLELSPCPCEECPRKMKKQMQKIHGIGSIGIDMAEGKVTITDSIVDPDTVIKELEKIKKKAKLFNEEIASMDKEKGMQIVSAALMVSKHVANNQVIDESSVIEKDCHAKHKHKFELKTFAKRFTCDGCKEEGFGHRYLCQDEEGYYEFHPYCMFPDQTISHELYKGLTFEFSLAKPSPTSGNNLCRGYPLICEACGKEIRGYLYHCKSEGLSLHPCCVNFRGGLPFEGMVLKSKASTSSKCCVCGSSELNSLWGRQKRTHTGWSYVSKSKNFQIHVNCLAQRLVETAHEAWKQRDIEDDDDAYRLVLEEILKKGLIKKSKSNGWSRSTKEFVKMIFTFARAIIGILLGDPTVILASMVVELLKT